MFQDVFTSFSHKISKWDSPVFPSGSSSLNINISNNTKIYEFYYDQISKHLIYINSVENKIFIFIIFIQYSKIKFTDVCL